jgi:hypothetical protein
MSQEKPKQTEGAVTESVEQAAAWMLSHVEEARYLHQEDAAYYIQHQFGDHLVYINERGTLCLGKPLLNAFRRISSEAVVWVPSDRHWRLHEHGDQPGRQQDL